MSQFPAIRIEGGLLGPDTLEQLPAGELPGQKPKDFGLDSQRSLTDEIASAFADARAQWEVFQRRLARLPEDDLATSVTRDAWGIPFLSLLGYELRYNARAHEIDGATFAISHRAGEADDAPPVHIVGARQELGRAAPTGRPRLAPHSLVQEYLNRTDHLWALVTNGLVMRLLRDCTFVRRQAYVEFDLRQILEEQRFGDFAVLYRLLHRTRLPRTAADAPNCLLEQYHRHAVEQGGRVRERLRDGVEACIKRLANGFFAHPANAGLWGMENGEWRMENGSFATRHSPLTTRQFRHSPLAPSPLATRHSPLAPEPLATRHSPLAPHDFYRQLLRLVYRLLFLLVSEDRGLISGEAIYREHYGVARLRRLLDRHSAYTEHEDIWCSLRVLWKVFSNEQLAACLGASPLNGALFEPLDLDAWSLSNRDFLEAFWHLAYYREDASATPRRVNYAALDVEELGSVYESLLDYHPQIDTSGSVPRFELAFGSERKSTGSYYTPPELVAELIRSALEPVLEERLAAARRMADELQRVAGSEWRVVWQMITEHFGEVHGNSILSRLGSLAESDAPGRTGVSAHRELPARGTVRTDEPDAAGSSLGSGEHRGGVGPAGNEGVSPFSQHRGGQPERAGNLHSAGTAGGTGGSGDNPADAGLDSGAQQTDGESSAQSQEELVPHSPPAPEPLATRHSPLASEPLATPHSPLARSLTEHALLSLRVLDPACGSGHFLLAAARRLGKELAKIRTGEDEPAPERVREAIRDVVAHCLYGVDKNPLAVELCRVVLWLEAHCMGKPLTFLDHRIKCGDSLIGVLDLDVLEAGLPDEAFTPVSADDKTAAGSLKKRNKKERHNLETGQGQLPFDPTDLLAGLRGQRQQLEAIADDSPEAVRRKKNLYDDYYRDPQHRKLAEACHLWTAAFFQRLTPETAKSAAAITTQVITDHLADRKHPQAAAVAEALAAQHRFFHWPLEFPELKNEKWKIENGKLKMKDDHSPFPIPHSPFSIFHSFDVVLGNPPFMGGLKISGNFGDKYRHWLEVVFAPYGGTADLCVSFFRRGYEVLRPGGYLGLVATNTISQGDARQSGLAALMRAGAHITFAKRFVKWPGAANVEVNLIALHKPHPHATAILTPTLDGQAAPFISSRLDTDPETEPKRLPQNKGKAFQGSIVLGMGFVLKPHEAQALIARDPRNADCIFPYLNGEDLNSHPEQQPSRWVIQFDERSEEDAQKYADLWNIVMERVWPERRVKDARKYPRMVHEWWKHWNNRQELYHSIASLRRVLVRSRVSELHMLAFVPPGSVYGDATVVFAFEDDYHFALLQSAVHEAWVRKQASSLRTDIRYTPTDCFATFPFPPAEYEQLAMGEWRLSDMPPVFQQAAQIGKAYHTHRCQIMLARQLGLTKTYNLFHNPACQDADILCLRELHAKLDRVVLTCYGWDDLLLRHDFHQNERGQTRYTFSPAAHRELLARLLRLNGEVAGKEK